MSAREWKPGDVARTTRGGTVARTAQNRWVLLDDGHVIDLDHNPRPLVVIDPEDREQVERLRSLLAREYDDYGHGALVSDLDPWSDALREFANPKPPKPEEPKGDGAVVEDAMGHRWVRIAGPEPERESKPWRHRGHTARDWEHLSAVRILSEGVQA